MKNQSSFRHRPLKYVLVKKTQLLPSVKTHQFLLFL